MRVLYEGRVQGVGFRYTARGLAGGFPVAGFVRNLKRIASCKHVAADASHLFRGKPVNILPDHVF